ncbi:MAG: DNA repair protein RecN [Alphaproteobacteria bacterium]
MLNKLQISNIVLIEKLNIEFGSGLNVLTGETGAGKSILMDALSLALGARSDTGLVRAGCDNASVIAEFDSVPNGVKTFLQDNGIDCDDDLIVLRRTLSMDGKSRAWVNDIPVSIRVLKEIGDRLVEIHGQFANHTLLNPATHRPTLDTFASNADCEFGKLLKSVENAYNEMHGVERKISELRELLNRSETEHDFLEHNVAELKKLNVRIGEEQELSDIRSNMMNAEKNNSILSDAQNALCPHGTSLDALVCDVAHILERLHDDNGVYADQISKLYDVAQTISDVSASITPPETDIGSIDEIEERLFAIRGMARKHRVMADELPNKLQEMENTLNSIDNSDAELRHLEKLLLELKNKFNALATELSNKRKIAADKMRKCILSELPELKLGNADFIVDINANAPSVGGGDDVVFMIKTNPGMPFAPLNRAASGGELSRFMLALRVVLAGANDTPTFVFDEIDTGISGATASAIGLRLNKLAHSGQALVITHSAQVAGFADKHFKIAKHSENDKTTTSISEITGDNRLNEIARIISGAEITTESIEMAKTLIK